MVKKTPNALVYLLKRLRHALTSSNKFTGGFLMIQKIRTFQPIKKNITLGVEN